MKRAHRPIKEAALIVALLVAGFVAPLFPSLATTISDIALGTTKNFSIVSSGVINLGALARFTGSSPVQIALTRPAPVDSTAFTVAGVDNFIQNSDTATTAISDAKNLQSQLESLSAISRNPVLGSETITAGVYLAESSTAMGLTTAIVLDGGGNYNSIFVFRSMAAFNVTAGLKITTINGAQPSHIFWIAQGAITIGANVEIPGNFISPTAINVGADDVITGSLLLTNDVALAPDAAITLGERAILAHSTHLTLSAWNNVAKNYGDTAFSAAPPSVIEGIAGIFTYVSETPTVISVAGSTFTIEGVGSSRITTTFTANDSSLYYIETATMVITIGLGTPVITWSPASSLQFPDTATLLATGPAGSGTISYAATSGGCSVDSSSGVVAVIDSTQTCSVIANIAANSYYVSASSSAAVITLSAAAGLTPIFDNAAPTAVGFTVNVTNYVAGTTFNPTINLGSVTAGTVSGSILPLTITGLTTGQSAIVTVTTTKTNTTTLSATVSSHAKYLGPTVTTVLASVTSGTSINPTFTVGGLQGSDAITAVTYRYVGTGSTTYSSSLSAPTAVGTYSVTPSAAVFSPTNSAASYATVTYNSVSFSITAPPPPPPAPEPPAPVVYPDPTPTPSPSPLPTPTPSPLPTPSPSPLPTPTPSPIPTPTPTPTPSPTPTPAPLPAPTMKAKPFVIPKKIILPEVFTLIEILPIRKFSGSLWDSLHISIHNMAIGQKITITLKDIS